MAMLCDFGLAKVVSEDPTGLTTSEIAKGTLRYASPEIVIQKNIKSPLKSDVWAWGCLVLVVRAISIPCPDF